jgi:hypothetical protein
MVKAKVAGKSKLLILAVFLAMAPTLLPFLPSEPAHAFSGRFAFPVIGGGTFSNDYNAPRSHGPHHAIDILAPKHRKIIAAVSGTITFAPVPQPSYGYIVNIRDDEGYKYGYLHINNDTPGTDDGNGGPMHAYAPYVKSGNRVVRGQLIGYVGDSGNAENTVPHLHFQVEDPDGNRVNPYNKLLEARHFPAPVEPPAYPFETLPYGTSRIGVSVAMGNTDLDIDSETITAAGPGGGPHIKLFDADGTLITGFFAYAGTMQDGVDVAAGDMDGDGVDEIITAPGPGSGPHIKIFSADGTEIRGFGAYAGSFRDGVHVAAGDMDGDGTDEIITIPGPGSAPHVKIFSADGTEIRGFSAYVPSMRNGADVAVGNMDADLNEEIITAPGENAAPLVRIYEADGVFVREFLAYQSTLRDGLRISAGNTRLSSSTDEIATVPEVTGVPGVRLFSNTGNLLENRSPIENWWIGYHDVALGLDKATFGTGVNRRASFMEVF